MNEYPLLSVVLPVYNCAMYIEDAINSILNQTIQDFEIIVIDDCSTDDTIAIIEAFMDTRIRIIKKESNKGLIDSLNIGFETAKGIYIARMDGDDINELDRFEKQLEILQNNPEIQACGCWLKTFGSYSTIIKHKKFHKEIQAQLLISNPMSLGATMLKRKAYENYRFENSKIHAEDYDFWARSAWDCSMYNIQEALYNYRVHNSQVSTKYKTIQLKVDIDIKLSLFHNLKYNREVYSDELIAKLLYSNKSCNIHELKLIFNWFKVLLKNNKELRVFDCAELKKVVLIIRRKLVFDIFLTNTREGMNYKLREKIFKIIPFNEKSFILKKKLKEKYKLLFKN